MLVASRSNAAKNKDPVRLCLDHLELRECCLLEGDRCSHYQGHVQACKGCCLLEGDHSHYSPQSLLMLVTHVGHVQACQGGAARSAGVPPAGAGLWAAACIKEPVCVCSSWLCRRRRAAAGVQSAAQSGTCTVLLERGLGGPPR